MSDTLTNALRDSAHSSSVLAGIANPAQLNPLAGISTAQQLVGTMQGLDKNQAEKAWGEVLQQATDKDGNVNYPRALALASQRPDAAYGMRAGLTTASELQGQQMQNAASHLKMVGLSAMTVARDPSDANINASFDNLKSSGMPAAQVEQERARWLAMSPIERQANAHRVGNTSLEQLRQVTGQTTAVSAGGQIVPQTVTQPSPWGPGGISQPPGAINLTLTPGEAAAPQTRTTPGGTSVTAPASTFAPPPLVPPQLQPRGGQNPMGTGRYPTPQGGAGGGSGTGQPGAGNIPGAGGAPVTVDPLAVGGNEADFKQYRADVTGVGQHYQNINTLNNARSALDQARTGKGIAPFQTLMSVINTIAPGWTPDATKTQTEQYDLAKKYLSDYARNSGAATHSDAQLSAAQASNPSIDISNLAARDVVSYQTGRERQAVAQTLEHGDPTGRGYQGHAANFAGKTDPRGFAWDTYTDEQKRAIAENVEKDENAKAKLARSINMARRLNLMAGN